MRVKHARMIFFDRTHFFGLGCVISDPTTHQSKKRFANNESNQLRQQQQQFLFFLLGSEGEWCRKLLFPYPIWWPVMTPQAIVIFLTGGGSLSVPFFHDCARWVRLRTQTSLVFQYLPLLPSCWTLPVCQLWLEEAVFMEVWLNPVLAASRHDLLILLSQSQTAPPLLAHSVYYSFFHSGLAPHPHRLPTQHDFPLLYRLSSTSCFTFL